jgi:hypothetical protein
MADAEDCEQALQNLAAKLSADGSGLPHAKGLNRTLSVRVPDLDITWTARLVDGVLTDLGRGGQQQAQIRLTASSDDLVAVTRGELAFSSAWAAGRVRISASPFDLLRLRSLL